MTAINLEPQFGYVILVFVASVFVLAWKGIQVGRARKRYGVKYPTMYLPEDHKYAKEFNCIQRAHQNTLENYTAFLGLLLFAGLKYPTLAAAAGAVNLVGRIVYALGYYTGDASKRNRGAFAHLGSLALAGLSVGTALSLLGYL